MSFTIQTNIMSVNAQNNLRKTQDPLQTAMQRLSSGYRINSAKDDAAGMAISTRMTTQINGLNVAVRNANDGLSMAQTAEGAMNEVINNLQRIRELGVQAMSGQYGVTDIAYMQLEANSLIEETGRIAEQTKFNDKRLLTGQFSEKLFISSSASDAGVTLSLGSMNSDALGGNIFLATGGKDPLNIGYLKDVHTATSVGTTGVGDGNWVSGAGGAPAYSYTTNTAITYSGKYSFLINNGTAANPNFVSQASNAIAVVDGALNATLLQKAEMGAKMNQFTAVVNNESNVIETTTASRSRIMDADFATETANLTKNMILQQAGISVLSQANSAPQQLLALLK
ncbi:MAG: flagellin FliC [Nitrospirae bacterium]|nr:flagellin FliC [Nitrospirota bacterium]